MENDKLQLFEEKAIRTAWDEEAEEWYFSIVDVVAILTEQKTPRGASNYWAKLKQRLKEEGADQLLTNCQQLKMTATDGKKRLTDVATTEQLLRIIQSIPSPKAEGRKCIRPPRCGLFLKIPLLHQASAFAFTPAFGFAGFSSNPRTSPSTMFIAPKRPAG